MAPWPASEETFELAAMLKPLGEIGSYRFADWRNGAVVLSHARCASAVYSRPGEAYLLLANLDRESHEVTCVLHAEKLPHPMARVASAKRQAAIGFVGGPKEQVADSLDAGQLSGEGVKITIPGDGAVLVHVR